MQGLLRVSIPLTQLSAKSAVSGRVTARQVSVDYNRPALVSNRQSIGTVRRDSATQGVAHCPDISLRRRQCLPPWPPKLAVHCALARGADANHFAPPSLRGQGSQHLAAATDLQVRD